MESLPLDVEGPSDARCTIAAENAGATRRPIRFGVPDPVGLPLPPVLLTGQRERRMEQGRVGPSVAPEFPSNSSSLPRSSSSRRACVATSAPRVRRTHRAREGSRRRRAGGPASLHTS
jgi:hypothetical protein